MTEKDSVTGHTVTYVLKVQVSEETSGDSQAEKSVNGWLDKILGQNTKKNTKEVKPLTAKVYDFTPTGNLTLYFSKPFIMPPIKIYEIEDQTD